MVELPEESREEVVAESEVEEEARRVRTTERRGAVLEGEELALVDELVGDAEGGRLKVVGGGGREGVARGEVREKILGTLIVPNQQKASPLVDRQVQNSRCTKIVVQAPRQDRCPTLKFKHTSAILFLLPTSAPANWT